MNSDEFEYYFELDELESFAGTALTDLQFDGVHKVTPDNSSAVEPGKSAGRRSPGTPAASSRDTLSPLVPPPSDQFGRPARSPQNRDFTGRPVAESTSVEPAAGERQSQTHSLDKHSASHQLGTKAEPEAAVSHPPSSAPSTGTVSQPSRTGAAVTSAPASTARNELPPWQDRMSVHVLGQFAFCNRAGIYSAENGGETDLDEPLPQWGYLPNYDLERIEEQLAKLLRQSWLLMGLIVLFVVGMVGGVAIQDRRIFYPALLGALVCAVSLFKTAGMVLTLLWRRAAARRAQAREPDRAIDRIQQVNWWSLLKAGFEPVSYQRQFRHPRLALEGSPWRVLERGSLRIPVIKSGAGKLGDAKHTIYPKHELRLAAYAMLLEATEHVQVPYGVIFPADSHLGLAIPITPSLREQVEEQLNRANDLRVRSQRGESEPRPPADRKRCATCRLGEPVPISDTDIKRATKARIPLHVLADRMDRTYHCACADRFGSAPSHRRIIQLGLRSTVE